MESEEWIVRRLFAMQDPAYREFHTRLMPTVDPETVIGVRIPQLRRFAVELFSQPPGELGGQSPAQAFLATLPHRYYEQNNLHGFLIEQIGDFSLCVAELNRFLPCVNNWATCDLISPKVLKKNLPALLLQIDGWMESPHPYTVRFGIGMLMRYYLAEEFCPEHLERVAAVKSGEYYVNMMVAWYFATALAKQYPAALPYLEQHRLPDWVHQKAIQKAVESRRVSPEHKAYLRTLSGRAGGCAVPAGLYLSCKTMLRLGL